MHVLLLLRFNILCHKLLLCSRGSTSITYNMVTTGGSLRTCRQQSTIGLLFTGDTMQCGQNKSYTSVGVPLDPVKVPSQLALVMNQVSHVFRVWR